MMVGRLGLTLVGAALALLQDAGGALAAQDTGRVLVDVDSAQREPLRRALFGFNTEQLNGYYGYDDTALVNVVQDLRPVALRFPGGETANFYHWRLKNVNPAEVNLSADEAMNARIAANYRRLAQLQGGQLSFDAFMALSERFHIQPIVVVNVFTGTPEEAAEWVGYARRRGYHVSAWELGNELYGPPYRTRIPTPEQYLRVAAAFAAAMRRVDPSIRLGVPVSPLGFHPRDPGQDTTELRHWDAVLSRGRFYDAVIVHLYAWDRAGYHPTLETLRDYLFGVTDYALPAAIRYYRREFANMPIWITEWGIANPQSVLKNTLLHALYSADFFLGLLDNEYAVENAEYHVLAGGPVAFSVLARWPVKGGYANERQADYPVFRAIGRAVHGSRWRMRTTVSGAVPTLAGRLDYEGVTITGIHAGTIAGDSAAYVLIVNRTLKLVPCELRIGGRAIHGALNVTTIASADLGAVGESPDRAIHDHPPVVARTGSLAAESLQLPPNSFTVVQIPWH